MHYLVAMVTGFLEKIWRFIYVCGKFHTDTINQTVFGKEFLKLVWGKWKLFRASLRIENLQKPYSAARTYIAQIGECPPPSPGFFPSLFGLQRLVSFEEIMDPKGITNLGNTCYLNSVLQALLSINNFSEGLAGLQHNPKRYNWSRSSGF